MVAGADWHALMKRGDFEAAWRICDRWIQQQGVIPMHEVPRHLQTIWDGTPLHGARVLVRCYHGLGDTLQFLRFVPQLAALAAETTLWIQPALIELVGAVLPSVRLLPLHDGTPDVPFDVDVEIMELPHVFRASLATIPPPLRYLPHSPPDDHTAPVIAIKWSAGDWDSDRSIPFDRLEPLLAAPGVTFVPLQKELTMRERAWFHDAPSLDVSGVAHQIAASDLVITVDSLTAHLAGSLAVPTWTLLKFDADWRWLEHRRDSPWYPSMRLYRQPGPGTWTPVLDQVLEDIGAATSSDALTNSS